MMNIHSWIYNIVPTNLYRFSLGYCAKSPLLCIGVNPSAATPEKLDPTIRSVERIAKNNSYDGWIMINLYPQRSTDPNMLHQKLSINIHQQNLYIIESILRKYDIPEIWAAWGTLITKRDFLVTCLSDIYELTLNKKWITFGPTTKNGHPHHPLYLNANTPKSSFDIINYMISLHN